MQKSSHMEGDRLGDQRDHSIEAARQLGADEDEAAFKAKLAQVAGQKPKENVPEPDKNEKS